MKTRFELFALEMRSFPSKACQKVWQVGQDDPGRFIHALKVGFALTLVSLLYLLEPLFEGIGDNAIWAVMTVVVVFEFTAGATLCKGLNRGFGTVGAGLLAFLFDFIADEFGVVFQAIFIGTTVFLIGSAATYARFFPCIKTKNYDYGVVIFILTFNLITVSSYRVRNVLGLAHDRFYTIAIGVGICLVMSLLVFPNWSGEDLHKSTVSRFEALAISIEACVDEYFEDTKIVNGDNSSAEDPVYDNYKSILDTKTTDQTLALYASWEPRLWKCRNKYPGKQYVKLGGALRHFAYTAVALHGCSQSEIQTPQSVRELFRSPCTQVAGEVSKVLMELADSIRNRRRCSLVLLSSNLHKALQDLNNAIKSQPRLFLGSNHSQTTNLVALAVANAVNSPKRDQSLTKQVTGDSPRNGDTPRQMLRPSLSKIAITSLEFSEALPFAAFASLLLEMVVRLDLIIQQVEELGRLANFKEEPDIEVVVSTPVSARTDRGREFQPHLPSNDFD